MNETLEITTLGGLEIRVGGEPVTGFYSRKVEALLIYLACTGRPQSRDVLADLLWDEVTQSRAMGSLRVALHSLREKLGPYVEITRTTVALNLGNDPSTSSAKRPRTGGGVWFDAAELEDGLASPAVAEQVADAVSLYRGDFLAGFYVRDCPRFEEWQLVEQERLRELVKKALNDLAATYLEGGAYDAALAHARRLLELDPLLEEAHRQVMVALAFSGQRSVALAQYDVCREKLQDELGVEPEAETTALYEQIAAGDVGAPTAAGERPRHNLPRPVTPFVGREAELAEIAALLEDPACHLLTLVGPGGSGKTRLALETAQRGLERYQHGAFFVSLAPLTHADGIVPTVAEAVGFTFYAEERAGRRVEAGQQLLDYLRGKRMLLVMDNYEHLLSPPQSLPSPAELDASSPMLSAGRTAPGRGRPASGTALVSDILRSAPDVKILATSRSRLNVGGEFRFQVGGMNHPDLETLDQRPETLTDYSAVALFLQGARRARPDFAPTEDVLRDIGRVCRLVDGLPLGIRLAAGWMEMLTPGEIADEIVRSVDFLETERHDVPARQQSMRAVFDHSWQLLTERERSVMQALSVFRGGFTGDAAHAVSGASLRDLMTLVNRSLIHRTPGERYEVHELLRQYAAQELAGAAKGADAARDRHCAYYCAALEGWGADLWCERQGTAMAALRADRENARSAWDWAVERGYVEKLDQAVFGLSYFYVWRARYEEGDSACRSAADKLAVIAADQGSEAEIGALAPRADGSASPESRRLAEALRVWAKVLACYACMVHVTGASKKALQLARQSLSLLGRSELTGVDTRWEQAYAWLQAGDAAQGLMDIDERRLMFDRSLALYQELGEQWGIAKALAGLGGFKDGKHAVEESLAIQRELGDKRRMAGTLIRLSWMAWEQGECEEMERLARESIALSRASDDRVYLSGAINSLGAALIRQGRFVEACSELEESVALSEDTGTLLLIAWSLELKALALLHLGEYTEARALARRYLPVAQKVELRWAEAVSFFLQGNVALATAAYGEAQKLLRESALVLTRVGHNNDLSVTLAHSAIAARGLDQPHQTQKDLCEALGIATELGVWLPLWSALVAASLLLADAGQAERAVELYALASRHGYVANSRWFEDVAGKEIAAVAATLPPDVVAAAQERGEARDLWETAAELLQELEDVGK